MSLLSHELWPLLRPYMKVEGAEGNRFRLEFTAMPAALRTQALEVRVRCCACGHSIAPVRQRASPGNKRSDSKGKHLYFAAACPLEIHVGCSRGAAARDEYQRVKRAVEAATVRQLEMAVVLG